MLGDLPEDCYSLEEIRFIEDHGLGTFDFKEGWFGIPKEGTSHDILSVN